MTRTLYGLLIPICLPTGLLAQINRQKKTWKEGICTCLLYRMGQKEQAGQWQEKL